MRTNYFLAMLMLLSTLLLSCQPEEQTLAEPTLSPEDQYTTALARAMASLQAQVDLKAAFESGISTALAQPLAELARQAEALQAAESERQRLAAQVEALHEVVRQLAPRNPNSTA